MLARQQQKNTRGSSNVRLATRFRQETTRQGHRGLRRRHRRRRLRRHVHAAPAARPGLVGPRASRRAATSAAPGTGTAIPARAATSRACSIPIRSREELQQEWQWSERYAPQPEILRYANHVADRFDLRRDIQFDTRVDRAASTRQRSRWSAHRPRRRRSPRAFCVMATGCLSSATGARFSRAGELSRARPTTPATGRMRRRFHRQARRRDRHRLVGDPGDPGDRRAGAPAHRVPAHAEFQRSPRATGR